MKELRSPCCHYLEPDELRERLREVIAFEKLAFNPSGAVGATVHCLADELSRALDENERLAKERADDRVIMDGMQAALSIANRRSDAASVLLERAEKAEAEVVSLKAAMKPLIAHVRSALELIEDLDEADIDEANEVIEAGEKLLDESDRLRPAKTPQDLERLKEERDRLLKIGGCPECGCDLVSIRCPHCIEFIFQGKLSKAPLFIKDCPCCGESINEEAGDLMEPALCACGLEEGDE